MVSPGEWAWTFRKEKDNGPSLSRCDLALGNRAVQGLVSRVSVPPGAFEGGHSPVVVDLRDCSSWALNWKCPRPRLPSLLLASSKELRSSEAWVGLMEPWMASPEFRRLIASQLAESSQDVSSLLGLALQQLISLAGGWKTRSQYRRPASKAVLQVRSSLRLLGQCSSLLAKEVGVGTFSRKLEQLLNRLKHRALYSRLHHERSFRNG